MDSARGGTLFLVKPLAYVILLSMASTVALQVWLPLPTALPPKAVTSARHHLRATLVVVLLPRSTGSTVASLAGMRCTMCPSSNPSGSLSLSLVEASTTTSSRALASPAYAARGKGLRGNTVSECQDCSHTHRAWVSHIQALLFPAGVIVTVVGVYMLSQRESSKRMSVSVFVSLLCGCSPLYRVGAPCVLMLAIAVVCLQRAMRRAARMLRPAPSVASWMMALRLYESALSTPMACYSILLHDTQPTPHTHTRTAQPSEPQPEEIQVEFHDLTLGLRLRMSKIKRTLPHHNHHQLSRSCTHPLPHHADTGCAPLQHLSPVANVRHPSVKKLVNVWAVAGFGKAHARGEAAAAATQDEASKAWAER